MRWLDILKLRLRTLLHRKQVECELDEELQHHLAIEAERHLARGMSPDEARAAALRATGRVVRIQEECREARGFRYLEELIQDGRYALRAMRGSPAMAAVAVASLALGIGANTAVFSLINTVMLKSLPVAHPEQLVQLTRVNGKSEGGSFSYPLFQQLQRDTSGGAAVCASARRGATRVQPAGSPQTEQAAVESVSGEYFNVLEVGAAIGRTIQPEDNLLPNGNPVAVLGYGYWRRLFGSDPAILGKTLEVAGAPMAVIGVAPPEFFGVEVGGVTDVWIPVATMPQKKWLQQNGFNFLSVFGRLKDGVSLSQIRAQADASYTRLNAARLASAKDPRQRQSILDSHIGAKPAGTGFSALREQFSEPLRVLMAIVAGVLLIACSNIANLQLARASAREREIGVRLAIGAGRPRLIRQLLTESVLLALAGGIAGVAFAFWGCEALLSFVPKAETPLVVDLHPDVRVLGFTLAASLLAGILSGVGPAIRSTRVRLDGALQSDRAAGPNPGRRRLGRSLIAAQVALSMLLLAGSGLFIRTLMKLESADLGFDRGHVLTFGVNVLSGGGATMGLADHVAENQLIERVLERTQAIPGVRAVSYAFGGAYGSGGWTTEVHADGHTPRADEPIAFDGAGVGPRYFETMGIPLMAGRDFTSRDDANAPKVVAVNQTMARRFFGDTSPLGRHISYQGASGAIDAEIVALVRNVQHHGARKGSSGMLYAPARQVGGPWPSFLVRTSGPPAALTAALQHELPQVQARLNVTSLRTIGDLVDSSLARERLVATISGFFGAIALLLASIGVYGTMAYHVTRRTTEVGIRMTLGARQSEVVCMILREALIVVSLGVVAGALAARVAARSVESLLFGLQPGDLTTAGLAGAAMLLVAAVAGYVPARRAASVDPMKALRWGSL